MTPPEKIRIVFLSTPGIGHLVSTVEFFKRLLQRQPRFSALVLTMPRGSSTSAAAVDAYIEFVRARHALDIAFEELPSVEPPPYRDGMQGETFISLMVENMKPHARAAIARHILTSPSPVAAVVVDIFSTTMIDVADELGLPSYIFFPSTAAMLGLMLRLPALEAASPAEMANVEGGDITFPGFRHAIPPCFLPCFMMDKRNDAYRWMVHHGRQFQRAKGIIANTFPAVEPGPLCALGDGLYMPNQPTPPVYPIGPAISLDLKPRSTAQECLAWLDGQPPSSVVLLCFGSRGSFQVEQTREIAMGLERSGHRFLWVLRVPGDEQSSEEALPCGFLERTRGRGMVWRSWVPQAEVLGHAATGGFVTHCGWNSCLESLWFGVPMLAWPLDAEQHLNAFEMAREAGVAVGVMGAGGGVVGAEEVEKGVRVLIGEEGGMARERALEMKAASRRALEARGASFEALGRLADEMLVGGGGGGGA